MLVHVSSKKMYIERHSTYHLEVQRISNNMVLKTHFTGTEVRAKKGVIKKN